PISGHRHDHPPTVRDYTLNCEEPVKSVLLCPPASLRRFDLSFDNQLVVGHLHAILLEVVCCVMFLCHILGWFRWSRGSGADAVRLIVVLGQHNGRSLVAQAAVQPLPVVEHLDVLGHGEPGPSPGSEPVPVVHLVLQSREERLRGGIVPTHPRPSHRRAHADLLAVPVELSRGVLGGFNRWLQHRCYRASVAGRRRPQREFSTRGLSGAGCSTCTRRLRAPARSSGRDPSLSGSIGGGTRSCSHSSGVAKAHGGRRSTPACPSRARTARDRRALCRGPRSGSCAAVPVAA